VYGTEVYSAEMGPNGPALERFTDLKKKKMEKIYIWYQIYNFYFLREKKKEMRFANVAFVPRWKFSNVAYVPR
jgi:hypothetical protein